MRNCSAFEPLFDGYLDGTLSAVVRVRLERHLADCEDCRAMLAELRLIDGLLMTTPHIDPAPNFTFAVMAEVRSLAPPKRPPNRAWLWIVAYLAIAWLCVLAWMASGPPSAHVAALTLSGLWHLVSFGMGGLITTSHIVARQPFGFIWIGGVLLVLDITVTLAAVMFYVAIRPRLLARLSRPEAA